ncbi:CDP-glucose 4,6-dehydratase [Thermodesulfovibrionales bacterium]|nr:CDP-glucose 4,6-dehydratase [Thermodesulfovibrionales bacterium]
MKELFNGVYRSKKVLVTGHTGFKGSWLSLWLIKLGAEVIGYALEPLTKPSHFELLNLDMVSIIGDIRDRDKLNTILKRYKPDIIFHLAAQPLVRYSYTNPVETFETNVMGTINLYEACKKTETVRAIVNITSDKCYENREWVWGYRENDPMGGYDPYSSSKGCVELVTSSYRRSFFNPDEYGKKHNILLASVRSGNVIGGGDWSEDRLIPDIIRAISKNEKLHIRSPKATRPWQHVLEPLSGYLMLGDELLEGRKEFADAWNFGPNVENHIAVGTVIKSIKKRWDRFEYEISRKGENPHEAGLLKLDCSKAQTALQWKPVWDFEKALDLTVRWYREYYEKGKIYSLEDIEEYINGAETMRIKWTSNIRRNLQCT